MALTPAQMISFFGDQALDSAAGFVAATESRNYYLATINCSEGFKCRLMQGLISWRLGESPVAFLGRAIQSFGEDWKTIESVFPNPSVDDVPIERVAIISYLVGIECPLLLAPSSLKGGRLLDSVIAFWLFGSWDSFLWSEGVEELARTSSQLVQETYALYKSIARSEPTEAAVLIEQCKDLFAKRVSDNDYQARDQTEGGGLDNYVTVDYRLAAIAKRIGHESVV